MAKSKDEMLSTLRKAIVEFYLPPPRNRTPSDCLEWVGLPTTETFFQVFRDVYLGTEVEKALETHSEACWKEYQTA